MQVSVWMYPTKYTRARCEVSQFTVSGSWSSVGGVAAEATVARQHNTGGTRTGYHGPWSLAAGERELSSDTGH